MGWSDTDQIGAVGFGWYNPETQEEIMQCWVWNDAGLAVQHLPMMWQQCDPAFEVVVMIADGEKWVRAKDAPLELVRMAHSQIEANRSAPGQPHYPAKYIGAAR